MPNVTANGIQIEYDTFGDPLSPPLLLIMGYGCQMILWDEEFCRQLVEKGHYVIRYDNRDIGLTSKFFEKSGGPKILEMLVALQRGEEVSNVPYTLYDMADDAIGLLDSLSIEKAHICGLSMGGSIAQIMATRYPSRVLSLISIMAGMGGDLDLYPPAPETQAALATLPPAEREEFIKYFINIMTTIAGPNMPPDEKLVYQQGAITYDRCYYPQGMVCQLVALLATGSRKEEVKSITAPTLVIHGDADPLAPLGMGKSTAETIPGAELLIIKDMGHGLSCPEVWPTIVEAIAKHTRKVVA
jgi:pimeloyl-ACP methyl ester carboxylesterase